MLEAFGENGWTFGLLALMWFAAFMTGQGLANTWRPVWHVAMYGVLLGLADRFLVFALFDGSLLSLGGFVLDTGVILAICMLAYRLTQVKCMVTQYPWIYERAGLFAWREREGD